MKVDIILWWFVSPVLTFHPLQQAQETSSTSLFFRWHNNNNKRESTALHEKYWLGGMDHPGGKSRLDDNDNDLRIPHRLGVTTISWGDKSRGYVSSTEKEKKRGQYNDNDLQDAYDILTDNGILMFETCRSHGGGGFFSSTGEHLLGKCMDTNPNSEVMICSTNPRIGASLRAIRSSVLRLGINQATLYQAKPKRPYSWRGGMGGMFEGFLRCHHDGYCRHFGGVNLNIHQVKKLNRLLKQHGYFLASNQFEYNILDQTNEDLINACKEEGVTPLIQNPFGRREMASGRWTWEDPDCGGYFPRRFSRHQLRRFRPLHQAQWKVAQSAKSRLPSMSLKRLNALPPTSVRLRTNEGIWRTRRVDPNLSRGGITPAMVAIHYIVAKGGVPLVDCHDAFTAHELVGCLGWELKKNELKELEEAVIDCYGLGFV